MTAADYWWQSTAVIVQSIIIVWHLLSHFARIHCFMNCTVILCSCTVAVTNHFCNHTSYKAGVHIPVARSLQWPDFVWWGLIIVSPQCGTCLHHFSDTYNFEVSPRCLENLQAPDIRHKQVTQKQGPLDSCFRQCSHKMILLYFHFVGLQF